MHVKFFVSLDSSLSSIDNRLVKKKAAFLLAAILLAVAAWFWLMLRPVNSANATPIAVRINPGTSVSGIAAVLEEKGLIRSSFVFKTYARLTGAHTTLQAGSFALSQSQSAAQIIVALSSGQTSEISVTIPEGLTVKNIDELLAKKGLGKPGDILACAYNCNFSDIGFLPKQNFATPADGYGSKLEGYLFPDTYFVTTVDYQPEELLRRMLQNFQGRILTEHATQLAGRDLHAMLTMASLVGEESRHDEERAMVAGILWKREQAGTVLGVDATVRYMLAKPTADITVGDLDTDSPYNTRKVAGLPPGPIASPGEASILAALNPKTSEYWYYLHDPKGIIRYAKTNDEHNANRAKYLY